MSVHFELEIISVNNFYSQPIENNTDSLKMLIFSRDIRHNLDNT